MPRKSKKKNVYASLSKGQKQKYTKDYNRLLSELDKTLRDRNLTRDDLMKHAGIRKLPADEQKSLDLVKAVAAIAKYITDKSYAKAIFDVAKNKLEVKADDPDNPDEVYQSSIADLRTKIDQNTAASVQANFDKQIIAKRNQKLAHHGIYDTTSHGTIGKPVTRLEGVELKDGSTQYKTVAVENTANINPAFISLAAEMNALDLY